MSERELSADIDREAATWAARSDNAPLSPEEQTDLETWLAGDSRRFGAYAKARAVLSEFADARHERADVAALNRLSGSGVQRRRLLVGGLAAAAAVVGVGVFGLRKTRAIRTPRGEIRSVPLGAGSEVTLNTATEIKVGYSGLERRVRLTGGEALFNIAGDASHSVVVEAGETSARASGASFNVRHRKPGEVEILVRDGSIALKDARGGTLQLAANQQAICSSLHATVISDVSTEAMLRELAWRDGMIAFDGMTLRQAASEFSRYSDTRIIVDDPSLADQKVTGMFSVHDPEAFARAASASLGLRTEASSGAVRILR